MKAKYHTHHIAFITFWVILLSFSAPGFSLDLNTVEQGRAAAEAPEGSGLSDPGTTNDLRYHDIVMGTPLDAVDDPLNRVTEKMVTMTHRLLKYVSFEEPLTNESGAYHLKSRIDTAKPVDTVFDVNLSLGIGYEEQKEVSISAVKLSSVWYSVFLDAVYDYKNNGLDLFLSSSRLNTYLMDGMKLEFQISPNKSEGAFVLSMPF